MNDDQIYLGDILDRIMRIECYTQDGKESFYQSLLIQDGVMRCFEIIGEAVKKLSPEIRQKYPDIPWRNNRDSAAIALGSVTFSVALIWKVLITVPLVKAPPLDDNLVSL